MSRAAAWKYEIGRQLLAVLVPLAEETGKLLPANEKLPYEHRVVEVVGLTVMICYGVKPLPDYVRDRTVIDVWLPHRGGKVFSAEWEPLEITNLQRGAWIEDVLSLAERRVLQ